MILVLASSLYEHDPQTELIADTLRQQQKPFVVLNPLDHGSIEKLELVQQNTSNSQLFLDGGCITPDTIYLSRRLRADCIIDFPEKCIYPNLFRQKVDTFVKEILFAFRSARFLPGDLGKIQFSESKTALLHTASLCGLETPEQTHTCFDAPSTQANFRKVLGYPFSISLNSIEGEEVAVTLTNGVQENNEGNYGLPWQWQTEVNAMALVRCVVVDQKVHCYKADWLQFAGDDLRAVQEVHVVEWSKYTLPSEVRSKLLLLMDNLGLKMACPEFLVATNGEHIFIDMNPCGDWFGFIDDQENAEVAFEIASKL